MPAVPVPSPFLEGLVGSTTSSIESSFQIFSRINGFPALMRFAVVLPRTKSESILRDGCSRGNPRPNCSKHEHLDGWLGTSTVSGFGTGGDRVTLTFTWHPLLFRVMSLIGGVVDAQALHG